MNPFSRMMVTAALASCALAVSAQTTRIKGTIEQAEEGALKLKLSDGSQSRLVLGPGAHVIVVVKASLSDIKEGAFIASGATPQPDGTQRAAEVRIFPEEMRGVGEGHRPYAAIPQGTMTNGTAVGSMVKGVAGSTITVKYKGGEKKIVVGPNTPIVKYIVSDKSELKQGASVNITNAVKKPDGTFEAARIQVGRDGLVL